MDAQAMLSPVSSPPSGKDDEIKVYTQRWVVLFLFAFSSFTNAYLWIQFSPIASIAQVYYSVPATAINALSLVFMVAYFPGTVLSAWVMDRYGVRFAVVVGSAMGFVCAAVRWLAVFVPVNAGYKARFCVTLFGQAIGALAQPFFTNAPSKMSSNWFPVHQRDIATVIAAMFNPLGNAAGSVIPSIVVSKPDDMPALLAGSMIWAGVITIAVMLWFAEKPPTPPSRSAGNRNLLRSESLRKLHNKASGRRLSFDGDDHHGLSSSRKLWLEGVALLKERNFVVLLIGFSVGLGVFNALLTLIAQIVAPCGYDSGHAGLFGGVLLGCGLLGAAIAGPLMEATHAYVELLKGGIIFAVCGAVFFLLMLKEHNGTLLAVSFGVMGFCMLPLLPLVLDNATEATYPTPEETGAAFLIGGGQIFGIIFIFVLGALINKDECGPVTRPSSVFLFAVLMVAVVVVLMFKKDYRRMAAEKAGEPSMTTALLDGDAEAASPVTEEPHE